MEKYDLAVIGGGATGFAVATKADELKIKTAFINTGLPMSETCVTAYIFSTFSEAVKIAEQSFRRDIRTMSCCVE